jgi:hypothetical protein
MMKTLPLFFLVLLWFSACKPKTISLDDLKKYPMDADNGLIQKIEKGDIVLEMYYKPKELIIAQQLTGVVDAEERNKITHQFDSLDYFVLRLSRKGNEIENSFAGDQQQFTEVVNYLSYEIAQNFSLTCGADTLAVLDAVYARTFGSATATSVMAVFQSNLTHRGEDAKVYFNDKRFGTGLSEFVFESDKIQSIPTLKYN